MKNCSQLQLTLFAQPLLLNNPGWVVGQLPCKQINIPQWRREGGGNAGTSPPETGKIVVEIWCYLPEVYTFGAESEIQEIFSKKL